jgi:hypothetical protein
MDFVSKKDDMSTNTNAAPVSHRLTFMIVQRFALINIRSPKKERIIARFLGIVANKKKENRKQTVCPFSVFKIGNKKDKRSKAEQSSKNIFSSGNIGDSFGMKRMSNKEQGDHKRKIPVSKKELAKIISQDTE